MITGSVALVLVAAGLWIVGIQRGSDLWYYSSIVASILAAFALMVGVRQRARARIPEDDFDVDPGRGFGPPPVAPRPTGRASVVPRRRDPEHNRRRGHRGATITPAMPPGGLAGADEDLPEPPDEPPPQILTEMQARRIASMTAEVVVIDGRPRYHQVGCMHLLGRDPEQLPVAEAVQLGFTPCSHCEPARGLLASPRA